MTQPEITQGRVCAICDGGPGNQCACTCGLEKWENGSTPTTVLRTHRTASAAPLVELLKEVKDTGLIYWEPVTERGYAAKADMLARIDAALAQFRGEVG